LAVAQDVRADEEPYPTDQTPSDAGADDSTKRVASDAGTGQMPDLAPADSHVATADTEFTGVGAAVVQPAAGPNAGGLADSTSQPRDVEDPEERQSQPVHAADLPRGVGPSEQDGELAVVTVAAAHPLPRRLPILGLMADVGVPDGLIGSLAIRPWNWVRFCAGGGTNGISSGWRAGLTLLPFGAGPSASLEYGRYQDGDVNTLAKKLIGGGFDGSPLLDRVGYGYMNAHLGLDFGSRRFVFFIHGGVTMLRGQIHNLNAAISGAGVTGATEVAVEQDPTAKAIGPSVKLGLVFYIW